MSNTNNTNELKKYEVTYVVYGDDGWYEKTKTYRAKDRDDAKDIVVKMSHHSPYPIKIFSVDELGKVA